MRFLDAQLPRPVAIGLLASLLLSLGACQFDATSDDPDPQPGGEAEPQPDEIEPIAPPDVVVTTFQGSITQPTIVTLTPAGQSQSVSLDANIGAEFNVELTPASATNAITVTAAGATIRGTTSYDAANLRITFDPAQPLPANTTILVNLGTVESTDGGQGGEMQWTFTTGN